MSAHHEEMGWLIDPPEDFRHQCSLLNIDGVALGISLRRLAATRLNANQLTSLSSCINRAQARGADLSPLVPFRLAVVGNATTNLLCAALPAAAARHGINLILHEAEYDQLMQEALDPNSSTNLAKPDAILLALDFHGLNLNGGAIEFIKALRDGFRGGCGAPLILQSVVCPPTPLFGSLDSLVPLSLRKQINDLNQGILELVEDNGDYLLDVAALAEMVGTQNWQDPSQWNLYKLSFSQSMVPIYVEHISRILAAIRGLSKKCLVLDLDNTIWGGVIGDDGLGGIKVGQGDGVSEAFIEVQKMALTLRNRGIILAVCSKNEDAIARQPFQEHPHMILREDHISVFQANWRDKASNLEAIAKALNIGIDSLVFLDDNPAERNQVRTELPMVAVPELPDDVSYYTRTLLNAGYFEAIHFSEDDKLRAEQYRANAKRVEIASTFRSMDEFLDSLEMKMIIGSVNSLNIDRVTQLINKTNQFNLTTKRYTQADVQALIEDPNIAVIQIRLTDKFGDNGLISVGICGFKDGHCEIDSWLMSCRVLGRRVEEAMLMEFARLAKKRSIKYLRGRYIPTPKNAMVRDLYGKLGFSLVSDDSSSSLWELQVENFSLPVLPFNISTDC